MKTNIILLLIVTVLLSSCSYNYTYPSKKITVRKTDGTEKEYGLLSVRGDSAIVVLDWAEAHVNPLPYSHAEVIRKDSISNILRLAHGSGGNTIIGMVGGALLGGLIASQFTIPLTPGLGQIAGLENILIVLGGIGGGFFIGSIIGNLIPHYKDAVFNKNDSPVNHGWDTEFLRSISAYPDKEPDIMQFIK